MRDFIKKYKELIISLFPLCFLSMGWYMSPHHPDDDWSTNLPLRGYEFFLYNWGYYLILYLLCITMQIIAITYPKLKKYAILGHIAYLYSLFFFPMVYMRTLFNNFYIFFRAGFYIAFVCEILAIILNVIGIFTLKKESYI